MDPLKKHGSRFHRQKVGVTRSEPYWAVLVSLYSSVGVLRRLKGCWKVRATHAVRWLVGRIALPWDRGILINKHIIHEVFLDNGKSFVYWRKCRTKVCRPSWTSMIFVYCARSPFSLDLSAGYTVSGCYWGHNAPPPFCVLCTFINKTCCIFSFITDCLILFTSYGWSL